MLQHSKLASLLLCCFWKALISTYFSVFSEKNILRERLKEVRKFPNKGVRRIVAGSTGWSLSLIFCLLHSLVTVPTLMTDVIAGNGITCRISCYQYAVVGTWIWPLSKTFLCRRTLQYFVGSLQCWCCFSMSFVGSSRMSFCQHLLCVFGLIYIPSKHWI